MLRIALIGVGVVTAAVTGWFVKRQFFSATDDAPPVVLHVPPVFRSGTRRKKGQPDELCPTLENGEGGADPVAYAAWSRLVVSALLARAFIASRLRGFTRTV